MAKKFFPKALSVGLSLALCAGMVAPAFAAAVAFNPDKHVGEDGSLLDHANEGTEERTYDYFLENDVTLEKTLVVKNGADASIDLNGNDLSVKMASNGYNTVVKVEGELTVSDNSETGDGAITGGNGLNAGGGVHVDGGSFTLEGGSISGNSAYRGAGGVYVKDGKFNMTGGSISDNTESGVRVDSDSTFTMNGGKITNNSTARPGFGDDYGGGVNVKGENASFIMNEGLIEENEALHGAGVSVRDGANAEMNGGKIENNTASLSGGGVFVWNYNGEKNAQFTMNGGEMSQNKGGEKTPNGSGGAIAAYGNKQDNGHTAVTINGGTIKENFTGGNGGGIATQYGNVDINGGEIAGNTSGGYGGGIYSSLADVTIDDGKITGNTSATYGGAIYVGGGSADIQKSEITENKANVGGGISNAQGEVRIGSTTKIHDNTAIASGDDVFSNGGKLTLYLVDGMNANLKDNKPITGWYHDGSIRWGDGYNELDLPYKPGTEYTGGTFYLKAAHDQYFNVEYTDGADGTLFETQQYEVENKKPIPVFSGEIPSRPGYTFAGWLVDGENFDPATGTVTGTLTLVAAWIQNPVVIEPETPDLPDDTGETEIDDQAIPLAAGPVTRAEFIDYLWRHEGEPASDGVCTFTDVPEDHQFVLALAWAEQNGIAEAYLGAEGHEDGTFEPDELVTVGDVREFLGSFARVFGGNAVDVADLTTLTGSDDEAVLNCDQVIAEFFGEEYTPANTKNDELDIAA